MIRRPPRSTLFPTRRSSDLLVDGRIGRGGERGVRGRGRRGRGKPARHQPVRSEEHTSELQSLRHLVCRLLLEKKKQKTSHTTLPQACPQSVNDTPPHY